MSARQYAGIFEPYTKAEAEASLRPLLADLVRIVDQGRVNGDLAPIDNPLMKWRILDFQNVDGIPQMGATRGELIFRRSWDRAVLRVVNSNQELPSLLRARVALARCTLPMSGPADWLMLEATRDLLEDPSRPCPGAENRLAEAVAVATGTPVRVMGRAHLGSLSLRGNPIEFEIGAIRIHLSVPTREELEIEIPPFPPPTSPDVFSPRMWSAVARIETPAVAPDELRKILERLVCGLRLFRSSSVKYVDLDEAIISPLYEHQMSMGTADRGAGLRKVVLGPEDHVALTEFLRTMWNRLPLREIGGPEPTLVAYERFTDSVTLDAGLPERRIANAIMGLESLYLPSEKEGELSFRLRSRASTVLGMFGLPPFEVMEEIREAYGIRSLHVHGSRLPEKGIAKVGSRFGSVAKLLDRVTDDLRVSIVLTCLLGMDRQRFVNTVDRAMISDDERRGLKASIQAISPAIPKDSTVPR